MRALVLILALAGCDVSALGTTSGSGSTGGTGTSSSTTGGNCPTGEDAVLTDAGEVCVAEDPDGGLCPYWPPQPCGAIQECVCADSTNANAGCAGPPTCDDACCGHGGTTPTCAAFGASCETGDAGCCSGLLCVQQDNIASCRVANGQQCQGENGGCASGACAQGDCVCQVETQPSLDCGSCCSGACTTAESGICS